MAAKLLVLAAFVVTHSALAMNLHTGSAEDSTELEAGSCVDESSRRRSATAKQGHLREAFDNCKFFSTKKNGRDTWCATSGRRRNYAGEAKATCKRTCGLCKVSTKVNLEDEVTSLSASYMNWKTKAVAAPKVKAAAASAKATMAARKEALEKRNAAADKAAESAKNTPTAKVLKLIKELKGRAEADGKAAQQSYDKYACWCEDKLAEKAAAMNKENEVIAEQQTLIFKLNGQLGSHQAEIANLKKSISSNRAEMKDAEAARKNEFGKYDAEKIHLEQSIGALEGAIKVMTGAGTKKGFLDTTTHQAQLLSVAGTIRPVVYQDTLPRSIPEKDVELLKNFLAKPQDFFSGATSALQTGQNPFGDYAPGSTQIQGIFKGMYDAFTADLEKANAEEADSQKSFESFSDTKAQELATLQSALSTQEGYYADKDQDKMEAEMLRENTADELEADTAFFEDTKDACKTKAKEWSTQTRLRTEELSGMEQAIEILTGGESTFKHSFTNFLQLSSSTNRNAGTKAFKTLKALATKYKSLKLARIALAARNAGHFDKVIESVDSMVANLRKEEQDDIDQRDECERQEKDNSNDIADLDNSIDKTNKALKRMQATSKQLKADIDELERSISATDDALRDLGKFRDEERAWFKKTLKDDTDGVDLMKSAIASLSKFYENNNFIQVESSAAQSGPKYSHDEDEAPETSFSGSNYGGRKSETTGILETLDMLVEDIQKEISEAKSDDADAQEKFEKQDKALEDTKAAYTATKVSKEKEVGDLDEKMADYDRFKSGAQKDKDAEGDRKKAIYLQCNWVKTSFKSRATKRKAELEGLYDAKDFLSGGLR